MRSEDKSVTHTRPLTPLFSEQDTQRFATAALATADWFWEMDADLRFSYQSEAFEAITGLRREDVLGKTREEAFAEYIDDDDKWRRLGADLCAQNPYSMIWGIRWPAGGVRILQTCGMPFYDDHGSFAGFRGVGRDITRILESRDTVDLLRDRLRDFTHIAADWLWEVDTELCYSYLSVDKHLLSGQTSDSLIGMHTEDFFVRYTDIAGSEKLQKHLETLAQHKPFELEYGGYAPDGTYMRILALGQPLFDESGNKFLGYRGVGRDITTAWQLARRLLEKEAQYREVIENVTDTISIVDGQGSIKFENSATQKMLGYSVKERLEMNVGDVMHPGDRDRFLAEHERALNNPGQTVESIFRVKTKQGDFRTIKSTRSACHLGSDGNLQVVVHSRDITAQQKARKALRESEQRLRDFAETAADWFWEMDEQLRFTYISKKLLRLRKINSKEVLGKTGQEAFPFVDYSTSNWQKLLRLAANHAPVEDCEFEAPGISGETRTVLVNAKPLFDREGYFRGYRGSARDITRARALSEQLSFQASHDSLTGLVNRREFEKRLQRVLDSSKKDSSVHALCYLDLDRFKVVNDSCGHIAGDELLRQVADILRATIRKRDTIARLGGDEFGILLERCPLPQAERAASAVQKAIDAYTFVWEGRQFTIGVSIGLVQIGSGSGELVDVIRAADAACYAAKSGGRNRVHIRQSQ